MDTAKDFQLLSNLSVPAKRAAYSDRMAWMMALLSNIVYTKFDEESDDALMQLAKELALLAGSSGVSAAEIKERLLAFSAELATAPRGTEEGNNKLLTDALAVGGFKLADGKPIHVPSVDTQAMVVVREATDTEQAFAVLCFRGTQQIRDWIVNLQVSPMAVANPKDGLGQIGNMHQGFYDAYDEASAEITNILNSEEVAHLPLYVTGHSLGGALAVVATWYLSSKKLAACYTFGAPRVGDAGLMGWFKTPIYRVVNAADPVPFIPPSGAVITGLKRAFRVLAAFLPWGGMFDRVVSFLVRQQDFRHYGDMKYLPFAESVEGKFPDTYRIHPGISSASRLYRYVRMFFVKDVNKGESGARKRPDRVDKYHSIDRYCIKLRAVALNRNA